jgi:predicted lipid-binding transport protein (Tim44 family)
MTDTELLIYAVVAAVICYRLWSVLGKTNGDEKARAAQNVVLPESLKASSSQNKPSVIELKQQATEVEDVPAHLKADYDLVKKQDPSFSLNRFTQGAESAFETVLKAFSAGKKDQLKFLLSDEIYKNFEAEIDSRLANNQIASHSVYSMQAPKVLDIELNGNVCQVIVQFVSEQFNCVKDSSGLVISGSATELDHVTDTWVFERDLTSKKPNWVVVGIESA